MRLDVKALTITAALLWGGALFLVGISNLLWPGYGQAFLEWTASFYPGYDGPVGFGSVVVVTLYAVVDGGVCGLLFGWIYNAIAGPRAA